MTEEMLAQSSRYIITYEYETVYLTFKKSGRKVIIGDFYGDPEVAYISDDETYCVVGGCGLIIYYLKEPFNEYEYDVTSHQWKEIYRNPKEILWVVGITNSSNLNRIRFSVDPNDEQHKGEYEIDVYTLKTLKIK